MKNIIIVQRMSTGKNYIHNIIIRCYNPIVMELKPFKDSEDSFHYPKEISAGYKLNDNDFELTY